MFVLPRSLLQAVHAEGFENASVAKGVCRCFAEKSCQVSGQSVSCWKAYNLGSSGYSEGTLWNLRNEKWGTIGNADCW